MRRSAIGEVSTIGKVAEDPAWWWRQAYKVADAKGKTLGELNQAIDIDEFIDWIFFYEINLESNRNEVVLLSNIFIAICQAVGGKGIRIEDVIPVNHDLIQKLTPTEKPRQDAYVMAELYKRFGNQGED